MPVYTFKCDTCGKVFERFYHFNTDLSGITCPDGHSHIHKLFTPPTVIFKGPGFYVNDSRSKRSHTSSSTSAN